MIGRKWVFIAWWQDSGNFSMKNRLEGESRHQRYDDKREVSQEVKDSVRWDSELDKVKMEAVIFTGQRHMN